MVGLRASSERAGRPDVRSRARIWIVVYGKGRTLCALCEKRPRRALDQSYCKECAHERNLEAAKARRRELKALREECARLRALLKAHLVAVPDMEC